MSASATLVATLTEEPSEQLLRRLGGRAAVLEVRADLTGDLAAGALRKEFGGELLYTLRSSAEGGQGPGTAGERAGRLAAAAAAYDLVDLEGRDLEPETLELVPARKRLVSWHGAATDVAGLRRRLERLGVAAARFYKLVPSAAHPSEALAPLELLRDEERADLIAFAGGAAGVWTRLLAPRLGAPLVYGAAGARPAALGQPPLERLIEDYDLPALPEARQLFGVAGLPVRDSLSPRLYNGLFRRLGLASLYLPFEVEHFGDFWLDVVESGALRGLGFPLCGLSVTAPHKEVALAVAGAASPLAERIGAANSLVLSERVWEAETTDPHGVSGALAARRLSVTGARAAVLGAGGAGRAAAFALARAGAEVSIVNRTAGRGQRAAEMLGLPLVPLDVFAPGRFDVVVHATPLGGRDDDPLPFDLDRLPAGATVVDLVYRRGRPTRLVQQARARGLTAVDGREVLLHQAAPQFELMTGLPMQLAAAAALLGLEPPADSG